MKSERTSLSSIENAGGRIIMALEMESQGQFENAGFSPLFCGIGKVNAAMAAQKAIFEGAQFILNVGTAGSRKFKSHELIHVSSFVQRDFDLSPLGFSIGETPYDPHPKDISTLCLKGPAGVLAGVCGTGDSFEVGEGRIPYDLVDMEGYALAKVCATYGVPLISVKYITDGADDSAHLDWRENLVKASVALVKEVQKCEKQWLSLLTAFRS